MKTTLLPSLNWDIKIQPLRTMTGITTPRKVLMRNDNDHMLGFLSRRYVPLSNSRFMKLCRLIEKTGNFRIEGYSTFRKGKVVMGFLRNHDHGLNINGFGLNEYLVLGNTHDGSRSIFVGSSQSLVRCENQFTSTNPIFEKKHLGEIPIDRRFAETLKNEYDSEREGIYQIMEALRDKPVNDDIIRKLVKYLVRTDRSISAHEFNSDFKLVHPADLLRKSISKEVAELGSNAFGLFNGVTWYTSHELPRNINNFGNVHGMANTINQKALQFCVEL